MEIVMDTKPATRQQTDQARNSAMDKTDAYHPGSDAYASQGGGKPGSGMVNSGHPANNAINPHSNLGSGDTTPPGSQRADAGSMQSAEVKGRKGSGTPLQSAAGQRADDRPGRDDLKTDHASSSLNTHE
jgi:hypothetical protein